MSAFQVCRTVADHPYRFARGNSRAVERPEDRVGRRFVAQAVAGAHRPRNPALPSEMSQLGPEIVADLVAHDRDVAAELTAACQQIIRPRQRLQPLQVDAPAQRDLAPEASGAPEKLTVSLWVATKPAAPREKKKRTVEYAA